MTTLAEYLDETGETQSEFGHRAGVRQQVVSRWAAGLAIPRPHFMRMIERVTAGRVCAADFYLAHAARRIAQEAYTAALAESGDEAAAQQAEGLAYEVALAESRRHAPARAA